jgi:RNA polymerase sigma-70 factor (ECF subfamily)
VTSIESNPELVHLATPTRGHARDDAPLVAAIVESSPLQNEFVLRYRRALRQVFFKRRIPPVAIEDLLQRTFEQAVKKIRLEGLDDPSNLGGYLYRTACTLAARYWADHLVRHHDGDPELIASLPDPARSIEERIDGAQLAECVRKLLNDLPLQRDREVLERYYLDEEPRERIREALELTDPQFNNVLWRARQRFGDILRKHGLGGKIICNSAK